MAPVLTIPEGSEGFGIYCDMAKQDLGAMLMEQRKVMAYVSH